jgi:hypothetical protein
MSDYETLRKQAADARREARALRARAHELDAAARAVRPKQVPWNKQGVPEIDLPCDGCGAPVRTKNRNFAACPACLEKDRLKAATGEYDPPIVAEVRRKRAEGLTDKEISALWKSRYTGTKIRGTGVHSVNRIRKQWGIP